MCASSGVYVPRDTHGCDAAVLVRHHLARFLEHALEGSHAPLPDFVRGELRGFAVCGDFSQGFVRTACRRCGDELRVPFPCKGRGFCPSCMGRRMAEGAALLVDHVLPAVDYRQWVLSFSGPLAVRLGYDRELLAAVSERLARAVLQDIRREVKREHGLASVAPLHGGVVTVVQRFRSDLGLYVHLHCLVTDGAFEEHGDELTFRSAPPPSPERMTAILARVHDTSWRSSPIPPRSPSSCTAPARRRVPVLLDSYGCSRKRAPRRRGPLRAPWRRCSASRERRASERIYKKAARDTSGTTDP